MYSVKFRRRGHKEWRYSTMNIILSEHEIRDTNPKYYLCTSLREAQDTYKHIIARYKDQGDDYGDSASLQEIKISRMNVYLPTQEVEVLQYREFK